MLLSFLPSCASGQQNFQAFAMNPPFFAKAPAKHVVALAKTFAGGHDECRALRSIASCPEGDAEKSLQKVLKKFDLTLNVAVREISLTSDCMVPVLMPEDYIQVLCEKGFMHKLLGGSLATCTCPSIRNQLPTMQSNFQALGGYVT